MLTRGDSEKNLQGLTLELTECLPWSFRIMVRLLSRLLPFIVGGYRQEEP